MFRLKILRSLSCVTATAGFLVGLSGCGSVGNHATPPPTPGKINHVVIIFQENRTPDNLFGADAKLIANGADIASSGKNFAHHPFRFAHPHVQDLGTLDVHEIFLHLDPRFFTKLLGQVVSGRFTNQRLSAARWTVKEETLRCGMLKFLEKLRVQKWKFDCILDRLQR